jgi:hypothetical protein
LARSDAPTINALTSLRDDGLVKWDWIVDETRSLDNYTGYQSVKEGPLASD